MIETEKRTSTRDASDLQKRIDALSRLGDLESKGHHAHKLIEEIDTTKDKAMAESVERLHKENDYFIRVRRWSQRRRARRMFI